MRFDRPVAVRGVLLGTLTVAVLSACGMTPSSGPTVAYREAESEESLEIPPDLTGPSSSTGLSIAGGDSSVTTGTLLPEFEDIEFVRAGSSSWLELREVKPEAVWPRVDSFLRSQGLVVERREPNIGIMETGWAERYDSPRSGGITGFVGGLLDGLGSSNLRDKYLIRLERMQDGSGTRVFINHRAAQEVNTNQNTVDTGDYEWVQGAGDPAIEAEMARRLLVHLGLSSEHSDDVVADRADALQAEPSYTVDGGAARIVIGDPNPRRVFARVGDALARIGVDIRSAERERGVYAFDWLPPEEVADDGGFLGLFGGGEPEPVSLELQMFAEPGAVRIKAADEGGEPRSGEVHRALLRRLAIAMGADANQVRQAEDEDDGGFFGGGGRREEEEGPYSEPSR